MSCISQLDTTRKSEKGSRIERVGSLPALGTRLKIPGIKLKTNDPRLSL